MAAAAALKKTLVARLPFAVPSRIIINHRTPPSTAYDCRFSAACDHQPPSPPPFKHLPPDAADGIFRRYLRREKPPDIRPTYLTTIGADNLLEKLRDDNLKLHNGLTNPAYEEMVGLKEAVKVLKVSQLELIKEKLNQIEKDCVGYAEFSRICSEDCASFEQGLEFAEMLEQSGTVIVLKNMVYLKPAKILEAIKGLIPPPSLPNHNNRDPRIAQQFEEMEKTKLSIDARADNLVRRELWLGLAALFFQTAAFMRLTFWELSWDVMEPICFYVTSLYFLCGYAFFLRTSKEPSFEGFYHSRFVAKQRRLMALENFDAERFNELKKLRLQ